MSILMISNLAAFVLPVLLDFVLRGTLLLLAAWGVCLMLCRASAAVRHLIWTAALGGTLLLPLLSLSLPGWNVKYTRLTVSPAAAPAAMLSRAAFLRPTPAARGEAGRISPADSSPIPPQAAGGRTTTASTPSRKVGETSPFLPLLFGAGLALWLTGSAAVLAQFLVGLRRINRIGKQSLPLKGVTAEIAQGGCRQLTVRPPTFLQVGPENTPENTVAVPVTWGLFRPTVLLPPQAASWSEDCLRAALLHELAHVQRWDWLTQVAALFTCALYWWHPLVWMAAKKARAESERACDDLVLTAGMTAADYAQRLVEVMRSMPKDTPPRTVAIAMAQPSEVAGRITAVLVQGRRRGPLSRPKAATALLILSLVLTPLAVLRPVAQAAPHSASPRGAARVEGATPEAVRVLTQMAATYQSLRTYSGTEIATGSGSLGMPYEMSLAYQRPGRMAADVTHHFGGKSNVSHLLLDGKALYVGSSESGRYTRRTQPETNYTLWQDALIIREDVKFPIILEMLEQGGDMAKALARMDPGTTMRLGPPAVADGVPVDTVIVESRNAEGSGTVVWQIGRTDHLLRRYTEDNRGLHRDPTHVSQTFLNVRANPALPDSAFVFTAPAGAAVADERPSGADADPAAVTLVAKMYAAYHALTSFSCSMEMTLHGPTYGPNGLSIATSSVLDRATYAIQKPYLALITRTGSAGTSRAVCDGTTLYVTTTEPNGGRMRAPGGIHALPDRYLKLPVQDDGGNAAYNLANFGGLPSYGGSQQLFVPQAILGWEVMPAAGYDWKLGTPGEIGGESVDTVTLREASNNSSDYSVLTLAISRGDHLLRRVTNEFHQSGQPVQQEFDTFTSVKANPVLPASLFRFTPPPGSRPVPVASQLTAPAAAPRS